MKLNFLCNISNNSNIYSKSLSINNHVFQNSIKHNQSSNFSIGNDYKDLSGKVIPKHVSIIRSSKFVNENDINEIDVKFFSKNKKYIFENKFHNLFGLLKLYLLKEIAMTYDYNNIRNLSEKISKIMEILKRGKIEPNDNEKGIIEILNKEKGSNIMNFAKYVDELISQNEINTVLIPRLTKSKNDIIYIYKYLENI